MLSLVVSATAFARQSPGREDTTARARAALEAGRPYQASRQLAPLLTAPAGRDSATLLLAARAAAGWEGWATVVELLARETWLDRVEGGAGRALLARARVERSEDAVADAVAARATGTPGTLSGRVVTLARAYDRAGLLDSAAATYRRAAELLPDISDWLLLRAAGVQSDSAVRAGHYDWLTLAAARLRIPYTEALARDRTGDGAGAAERYDALGARLTAMRIRLRLWTEPDSMAQFRTELLALLDARRTADESRGAITLLDARFAPLSRAEELAVARRAAGVDRAARAAEGFARAARTSPLGEGDRVAYGQALARLARHREALEVLAGIRDKAARPRAEYARARSLLAVGRAPDALSVLGHVRDSMASDTATAAMAGFLAAETLVDRGDDAGARPAFLAVSRRFSRTSHGARAGFQAALIAYLQGEFATAAAEFAALAERPGDRSETPGALYWAGRALAAQGDTVAARTAWRSVWERFPTSYYVLPASSRLELPAELIPGIAAAPPPDAAALVVLDRVRLLEENGLAAEARFELERLTRDADSAPRLAGIAAAFAQRGQTSRAYRLALRSGSAAVRSMVYPIPRPTDLMEAAAAAGVDPLLAAAIIRQESAFDPAALSRADARGLMQVMPTLGAALARAEGVPEWRTELLFQPEINLRFGTRHLAVGLRRYERMEHALAAYNAGGRPTGKWLALSGAAGDPEVFIERIQYVETRDYVRRVLRNLSLYRALYPSVP